MGNAKTAAPGTEAIAQAAAGPKRSGLVDAADRLIAQTARARGLAPLAAAGETSGLEAAMARLFEPKGFARR